MWSDCLLNLGMDFLIDTWSLFEMHRTCGNILFPWLVFFFAALLCRSMEDGRDKGTHQSCLGTKRNASVISNWSGTDHAGPTGQKGRRDEMKV